MKNILILDGNNLLHRCYWVWNSYNKSTSTVEGILMGCIMKYHKMFKPDDIYYVSDSRLGDRSKSYRKTLLVGEYKATRSDEANEKIYAHESSVFELCKALGCRIMRPYELEGDDVMYWLCKKFKNANKTVVSVDGDIMQLVDSNTAVYSPIKDIVVEEHSFEQYNNISKEKFIPAKALIGDSSDNINGVKGIGPKKSAKLLREGVCEDRIAEEIGADWMKIYKRNVDIIDLSKASKYHPDEYDKYENQLDQDNNKCFDTFKSLCMDKEMDSVLNHMDAWRDAFFPRDNGSRLEKLLKSL